MLVGLTGAKCKRPGKYETLEASVIGAGHDGDVPREKGGSGGIAGVGVDSGANDMDPFVDDEVPNVHQRCSRKVNIIAIRRMCNG